MDLDGELISPSSEPEQVLCEGRQAGFQQGGQWIDEDARFALTLFTA